MQTAAYELDLVKEALVPRIGFLDETHSDITGKVDCDNESGVSGRYFNDGTYHTILTLKNIYDCQDDPDITDAEFNTYLKNLKTANIMAMLNAVFNEPYTVERGLLLRKQENVLNDLIDNDGDFVGFVISAPKEKVLTINNLLLHFDSEKTFNIYLYNEFAGLCETWQVTTKANLQQLVPVDITLKYQSEEAEGGVWFLGYFQSDLGDTKAIDFKPIRNRYCTFRAYPFSSQVTGSTFNMQEYEEYPESMFGLNASITVTEDITNLIVQNAYMFDELQGLMLAERVLELMRTSVRSNAVERLGRDFAVTLNREQNNITTDTNPYEAGLKGRIRREVKKIRESINKPEQPRVVSWG